MYVRLCIFSSVVTQIKKKRGGAGGVTYVYVFVVHIRLCIVRMTCPDSAMSDRLRFSLDLISVYV